MVLKHLQIGFQTLPLLNPVLQYVNAHSLKGLQVCEEVILDNLLYDLLSPLFVEYLLVQHTRSDVAEESYG